jgi:P27 family predicted phage terminase small subunit
MAGRPRKPDHLKIIEGDREDRINRDAPLPELTSLEPPVPLSDRAMEHWNKLAPEMRDKGILSDWDLPALAQACDCLALYWEFRELLAADRRSPDGPYVTEGSRGGAIKSPYWQMMRDAQAMSMQLLSRFGMTPADRAKLSVKGDDGNPEALDSLIS